MCEAKAEWKDKRGNNRWSQERRDEANKVYDAVDAAKASKMAAFDAEATSTTSSDLETAYQNEYADELQGAYDAALNAIKEGFIRRGIFQQGAYDQQKLGLDVAHIGTGGTTGQSRLDALAQAYGANAQQVFNTQRNDLSAHLDALQNLAETPKDKRGLVWGSENQRGKNPYYNNVWEEKVAEMQGLTWNPVASVSESGDAPEFLSDFGKLYLNQAPTPVVRTGSTTQSASPTRSAKRSTMMDAMGVRTPYSRKSQKVIG